MDNGLWTIDRFAFKKKMDFLYKEFYWNTIGEWLLALV